MKADFLKKRATAAEAFTRFDGPPLSLVSDAAGGLFLFYGDPALFALSPVLAGWRLSLGEPVFFLDGNHCFDPYPLVNLAKTIGQNPKTFLDSLFVSRAFTCHQMGSLVLNQLREAMGSHHPRLVILASPLETFYDESVPLIEARNLLHHLTAALGRLAPGHIFVVLSPFPKKSAGRRAFFLSYLKEKANRIFRVNRKENASSLSITEEKPAEQQWIFPLETG